MPPAPSVKENILADVKTSLLAIAPGGTAADGYASNVKAVLRWGRDPNTINEYPILVFGDVAEKVERGSNQLLHKTMTVVVTGYMQLPYETDDATGLSLTSFMADVEKALLADVSRGGSATDTIPRGSDVDVEFDAAPFARFSMTFDVLYRQSRTDPANPCAS